MGDGGWRRDYFEDNNGTEHIVNYSYGGDTCFREVPCLNANIPSLQGLSRKVVKSNLDYSSLPDDDPRKEVIEGTMGGKSRRYKRSKKGKKSKKRKNKTK